MASFFLLSITAALKGTIVLGVAGFLTLAMRRQSAAARHLVWTVALAGILALPFLSITLPTLRVPVAAPDFIVQTTASSLAAQPQPPTRSTPQLPPTQPAVILDWRSAVLMLWALGAAVALSRLLTAAYRMANLRRTTPVFCDDSTFIELRQLEAGQMPMTFGILRPVIFMPADAAQWPADRRRAVLLHELAHVTRHDVATHLLARVALSLYWWNPAVWMAWKQFLKEQEQAADDLVLASGAQPSDYATHLLEVARAFTSNPTSAAVAMARPSHLETRLAAILNPAVNRAKPGRTSVVLTTLASAAVILPLAAAQNYEPARKLLDASASQAAQVSGPTSPEYGIELIKRGDLENRQHNDDAATEFYAKAVQVLGDRRPEAGHALQYLAIAATINKNFAEAFADLERARAADPSLIGSALTWEATIRDREQKTAEAEALFRSALAASPESAITMRLFARFLEKQGRAEEAQDLTARTVAIEHANARPAPPLTDGVLKVGGEVVSPTLQTKVDPDYSREARALGLSGNIIIAADIGIDGQAHNLTILKGLAWGLDDRATEAIQKWRFNPGTKDGKPVNVRANIEVNFRLR